MIASIALLLALQVEAPAQPIPFSHKTHAGVGAKCAQCHAIRDPGFAAGMPSEALCMSCHAAVKAESAAIQELAAAAAARKPVEWVRVYRVPDYVWFSHRAHATRGAIPCETCHGAVAERDVLAREKPTSMPSCMDCHARSKVSNDCAFCHDPR